MNIFEAFASFGKFAWDSLFKEFQIFKAAVYPILWLIMFIFVCVGTLAKYGNAHKDTFTKFSRNIMGYAAFGILRGWERAVKLYK